jgi:hypothetical protein
MQPDINSLDLLNEPVEVGDVSGEDFFSVPLPDDGDHLARLTLGDRGVTVGQQKNKETGQKDGAAFLNVHVAAELLKDDGSKAGVLFDNPTSIAMDRDGQAVSKLAAILSVLDQPATACRTLGNLKLHTETTLAQGLKSVVVSRWEASAKAESTEEVSNAIAAGYVKAGKLHVGEYYTFLKGQKKFPEREDGNGYEPEVTNPITGEVVRAQAKIVRYKRA